MRVFKDYKDFLENKKANENGVTQYYLDKYYGGNLELAQKDNESNMNCFNCDNCNYCNNCIECNNCNNCEYCEKCNNCEYCVHCENFNDRNRLYATFNCKINNKDNQS